MEIYDENQVKEEYKRQLRIVKESAPDIWKQLLQVGLCPYLFGLPCDCGMNKECQQCWDQAMSMEYNAEVKITPTGLFYCATDNKFLNRNKTEEGDFYECPTCHKRFEMQHDETTHCVTKIISRGRKVQEEPVTDQNNPDYNEE